MTDHKIYKHTFTVTALTDEPDYAPLGIQGLAYDITEGDYLGDWERTGAAAVPLNQLAEECDRLRSDVEFFTDQWEDGDTYDGTPLDTD
jgi:hypothetical protein